MCVFLGAGGGQRRMKFIEQGRACVSVCANNGGVERNSTGRGRQACMYDHSSPRPTLNNTFQKHMLPVRLLSVAAAAAPGGAAAEDRLVAAQADATGGSDDDEAAGRGGGSGGSDDNGEGGPGGAAGHKSIKQRADSPELHERLDSRWVRVWVQVCAMA